MNRIFQKIWQLLYRLRYLLIIIVVPSVLLFVYFNTSLFNFNEILIASATSDLKYVVPDSEKTNLNWVIGKKYFSIDLNQINQQLLTNPFIASSFITKVFPNTLVVYITERLPFISLEIDKSLCVLLDESGYVLEKYAGDCEEISKKYSPIPVTSTDPKLSFEVNTQSTYYQINEIVKITKVLNEKKIPIHSIKINDSVVNVYISAKKYLTFSFSQDIEEQLARFVAILPELSKSNFKYSVVDLRYLRPVIKK